MYLFKASKLGDVVYSHQFGLFLLDTINTTWKQDSETITESQHNLEYMIKHSIRLSLVNKNSE